LAVAFRPALSHPKTDAAFAIARGTSYFIRVVDPARTQCAANRRTKARLDPDDLGVEPGHLVHYR